MLYQVADNTNDRRNLAKIESRRKAAFSWLSFGGVWRVWL